MWPIERLIRQFLGTDQERKREFVKKLGYPDVNTGVQVLDEVLRTGVCPKRVRKNLAAALGASFVEVELALCETEKELKAAQLSLPPSQYSKEHRLLLENFGMILDKAKSIIENPRAYFYVFPWSFGVKFAGFRFYLGELLSLWGKKDYVGSCPSCKSDLYLLWGMLNSCCTGICLQCREFKNLHRPREQGVRLPYPETGNRRSNTTTVEESFEEEEFSLSKGPRTVTRTRTVQRNIVEPFELEPLIDWLEKQGKEEP